LRGKFRHWLRIFTPAVLVCLLTCTAHAQEVTLAIWDFDLGSLDTSNTSSAAQYTRALPEILTEQLLSYSGAHIVERSRLREILDEQKLGSSSLSQEDTRIRLGKISGARYMIFGSALSVGPMTRLDVRLVSVETSQVVSSFEISGEASRLPPQMGNLAKGLANSLFGAAVAQSNVATNPGDSAIKTVPLSAATMALFDTGLAQMDRKDFEGAVETFKKVLMQTPGFAPAERNIRTSLEKLSTQ
jgi:curli biogenesis system outer membrane secretion channel CsgG